MNKTKKLKYGKIIEGAEQLSLGISVVVAILLGVAMGLWMKNTFNQAWLLWLGVFWGIGGAILNVKKAYDKQKRELDKIKVSDKKLKDYYNKNKDEFIEKESVHARHILVKTEDEAKKIVSELKSLKADALKDRFIALAKEKSTGPSGPNGGDLGYFAQGQMVPEFNDKVFSMKVGTISQPVKTQFGYHVIYLEDKKDKKTRPFAEVKTFIEQRLKMEKFKTIIQAKMKALQEKADIK